MARHFSIPTVLRMMPKPLLGQVLRRLGHVPAEIPWGELRPRQIEPVLAFLTQLSDPEQRTIKTTLQNVFDLACDQGWRRSEKPERASRCPP
jgi:hypothetical protein